MHNHPVLVTGSNSGLGKHCLEYFSGTGFARGQSLEEIKKQAEKQPFSAIIHCAYNTRNNITTENLYDYIRDNILLVETLLQIPHHQFIYVSTIDVYPKNDIVHDEKEIIRIEDVKSLYGISKLMAESIVQKNSPHYLILRPSALLGHYARENSLIRMLKYENPKLTLSQHSTFNYILHDDISRFMALAIKQNLTGIYNVCASENATLAQIANHFKLRVQFGDYLYTTGNVSNKKITSIDPTFQKNCLDHIILFKENNAYALS